MNTIAVIPTLNEGKYIGEVVKEALNHVYVVIVSDGQSKDSTREIAFKAGAIILCGQSGYGVQVRRGLHWAKELHADTVVLLDGDGQHNPADIPKLLEPIQHGKADMVVACRSRHKAAHRRFGAWALTFICQLGSTFKIRDAMSGFWAIRCAKLPNLTTEGWGMALEILIKARNNGTRISTIDVDFIYHDQHSDNSCTNALLLGLAHLWAILKLRYKCEVLHEAN